MSYYNVGDVYCNSTAMYVILCLRGNRCSCLVLYFDGSSSVFSDFSARKYQNECLLFSVLERTS